MNCVIVSNGTHGLVERRRMDEDRAIFCLVENESEISDVSSER